MFEKQAVYFLQQILGQYVKPSCFSQERLHVAVWSGHVILENVELKEEILDTLGLPIDLRHGVIGRLSAKIPWSQLGSEPVELVLDRVFLLIVPKYEWEEDAKERRVHAVKRAQIAAAEAVTERRRQAHKSSGKQPQGESSWFTERLLKKVIDNLQLHVRDVHIRFEDALSCAQPSDAFCCGLTLESLHMQSTDRHWRATYVDYYKNADSADNNFIHKILQVNHLCVYWNQMRTQEQRSTPRSGLFWDGHRDDTPVASVDGSTCLGDLPLEDMQVALYRLITKQTAANASLGHHYVLWPVDATVKLTMCRDQSHAISTETPMTAVDVDVSELRLTFEAGQYRNILYLMARIASHDAQEKYSQFRPRGQRPIQSVFPGCSVCRSKLSANGWTISDNQLYCDACSLRRAGQGGGHLSTRRAAELLEAAGGRRGNARRWWQYAGRCVLLDLREQRKRWSWAAISHFLADRDEYKGLWKRHLAPNAPLDPAAQERLNKLEYVHEIKNIMAFRSLAAEELSAENARHDDDDDDDESNCSDDNSDVADEAGTSWLNWALGWSSGAGGGISSEERAIMQEAFIGQFVVSGDAPLPGQNMIVLQLHFELQRGSVTLASSAAVVPEGLEREVTPFLELVLSGGDDSAPPADKLPSVTVEAIVRGADWQHMYVAAALQDLVAHQRSAPHDTASAFNCLVSRRLTTTKKEEEKEEEDEEEEDHGDGGGDPCEFDVTGRDGLSMVPAASTLRPRRTRQRRGIGRHRRESLAQPDTWQEQRRRRSGRARRARRETIIAPARADPPPPLLSLEFESGGDSARHGSPPTQPSAPDDAKGGDFGKDASVDARLSLRVEEVEIVFIPTAPAWRRLSAFFETPEVLGLWKELQVRTFNAMASIKAQYQAKLEYALANHFALDLDVDITAPVVIVPEDHKNRNCGLLVLDLGQVTITTERLGQGGPAAAAVVGRPDKAAAAEAAPPAGGGGGDFAMMYAVDAGQDGSKLAADDAKARRRVHEDIGFKHGSDKMVQSGYFGEGGVNWNDDGAAKQSEEELPSGEPSLAAAGLERSTSNLDGSPRKTGRRPFRHSLSMPSSAAQDPVARAASPPPTTASMPVNPFYDVFRVKLSRASVLVANNADRLASRSNLLDQFDINIAVHTSVMPSDPTLCRLKVFADLPILRFRLSQDKIARLLRLADTLSAASESLAEPDLLPPTLGAFPGGAGSGELPLPYGLTVGGAGVLESPLRWDGGRSSPTFDLSSALLKEQDEERGMRMANYATDNESYLTDDDDDWFDANDVLIELEQGQQMRAADGSENGSDSGASYRSGRTSATAATDLNPTEARELAHELEGAISGLEVDRDMLIRRLSTLPVPLDQRANNHRPTVSGAPPTDQEDESGGGGGDGGGGDDYSEARSEMLMVQQTLAKCEEELKDLRFHYSDMLEALQDVVLTASGTAAGQAVADEFFDARSTRYANETRRHSIALPGGGVGEGASAFVAAAATSVAGGGGDAAKNHTAATASVYVNSCGADYTNNKIARLCLTVHEMVVEISGVPLSEESSVVVEESETSLVVLRLSALQVNSLQCTLDTRVDVWLRSLEVEDYVSAVSDDGQPFRHMITSRPLSAGRPPSPQTAEESSTFLKLVFTSKQDEDGAVVKDVDLICNVLEIDIEQETIVTLMQIFDEPLQSMAVGRDDAFDIFEEGLARSHANTMRDSLTASLQGGAASLLENDYAPTMSLLDDVGDVPAAPSFSITARLRSLAVFLCDGGDRLAAVTLRRTSLCANGASDFEATVCLGNVQVIDFTCAGDAASDGPVSEIPPAGGIGQPAVMREIFGLRDDTSDSLVEIRGVFTSKDSPLLILDVGEDVDEEGGRPSADTYRDKLKVSCHMQSVKCVVVAPFVERMMEYVLRGPLLRHMKSGLSDPPFDPPSVQQQQLLQRDRVDSPTGEEAAQLLLETEVVMINPLVVLPLRPAIDVTECLVADLGKISLSTALFAVSQNCGEGSCIENGLSASWEAQRCDIEVKAMHLSSGTDGFKIVEDIDLHALVLLPTGASSENVAEVVAPADSWAGAGVRAGAGGAVGGPGTRTDHDAGIVIDLDVESAQTDPEKDVPQRSDEETQQRLLRVPAPEPDSGMGRSVQIIVHISPVCIVVSEAHLQLVFDVWRHNIEHLVNLADGAAEETVEGKGGTRQDHDMPAGTHPVQLASVFTDVATPSARAVSPQNACGHNLAQPHHAAAIEAFPVKVAVKLHKLEVQLSTSMNPAAVAAAAVAAATPGKSELALAASKLAGQKASPDKLGRFSADKNARAMANPHTFVPVALFQIAYVEFGTLVPRDSGAGGGSETFELALGTVALFDSRPDSESRFKQMLGPRHRTTGGARSGGGSISGTGVDQSASSAIFGASDLLGSNEPRGAGDDGGGSAAEGDNQLASSLLSTQSQSAQIRIAVVRRHPNDGGAETVECKVVVGSTRWLILPEALLAIEYCLASLATLGDSSTASERLSDDASQTASTLSVIDDRGEATASVLLSPAATRGVDGWGAASWTTGGKRTAASVRSRCRTRGGVSTTLATGSLQKPPVHGTAASAGQRWRVMPTVEGRDKRFTATPQTWHGGSSSDPHAGRDRSFTTPLGKSPMSASVPGTSVDGTMDACGSSTLRGRRSSQAAITSPLVLAGGMGDALHRDVDEGPARPAGESSATTLPDWARGLKVVLSCESPEVWLLEDPSGHQPDAQAMVLCCDLDLSFEGAADTRCLGGAVCSLTLKGERGQAFVARPAPEEFGPPLEPAGNLGTSDAPTVSETAEHFMGLSISSTTSSVIDQPQQPQPQAADSSGGDVEAAAASRSRPQHGASAAPARRAASSSGGENSATTTGVLWSIVAPFDWNLEYTMTADPPASQDRRPSTAAAQRDDGAGDSGSVLRMWHVVNASIGLLEGRMSYRDLPLGLAIAENSLTPLSFLGNAAEALASNDALADMDVDADHAPATLERSMAASASKKGGGVPPFESPRGAATYQNPLASVRSSSSVRRSSVVASIAAAVTGAAAAAAAAAADPDSEADEFADFVLEHETQCCAIGLVACEGVRLMFVNDLVREHVPIADFQIAPIKLGFETSAGAEYLSAWLEMRLRADYHNHHLVAWEPLVEPWSCRFDVSGFLSASQPRPANLLDDTPAPHSNENGGHGGTSDPESVRTGALASNLPQPWKVLVSARETLNVNITEPLLVNMCSVGNAFKRMQAHSRAGRPDVARERFSLHWIRNDTGVRLWYWRSAESDMGGRTAAREVAAGAEEPLDFGFFEEDVPADRTCDNQRRKNMVTLRLQRRGERPWRALPNVPVDDIGTRVFALHQPTTRPQLVRRTSSAGNALPGEMCVVCEVVSRHGVKVLVVRSPLMLQNLTNMPMSMHLQCEGGSGGDPFLFETVVGPGRIQPIPVHLASVTGQLHAVPVATNQYEAYKEVSVPLPAAGGQSSSHNANRQITGTMRFAGENGTGAPFYCSTVTYRDAAAGSVLHAADANRRLNQNPHRAAGVAGGALDAAVAAAATPRKAGNAGAGVPKGHLRVLSMFPPLVLTNLLSSSLDYTLCRIESKAFDDVAEATESESRRERNWFSRLQHGNRTATTKVVHAADDRKRVIGVTTSESIFWLGGDTEVARRNSRETGVLRKGDKIPWHMASSGQPVGLAIRLPGFGWSNALLIGPQSMDDESGGASASESSSVLHLDLHDASGSTLRVCVEISQHGIYGPCRHVSVWVPYWVVNASALTLLVSHDVRRRRDDSNDEDTSHHSVLNGDNGVAAGLCPIDSTEGAAAASSASSKHDLWEWTWEEKAATGDSAGAQLGAWRRRRIAEEKQRESPGAVSGWFRRRQSSLERSNVGSGQQPASSSHGRERAADHDDVLQQERCRQRILAGAELLCVRGGIFDERMRGADVSRRHFLLPTPRAIGGLTDLLEESNVQESKDGFVGSSDDTPSSTLMMGYTQQRRRKARCRIRVDEGVAMGTGEHSVPGGRHRRGSSVMAGLPPTNPAPAPPGDKSITSTRFGGGAFDETSDDGRGGESSSRYSQWSDPFGLDASWAGGAMELQGQPYHKSWAPSVRSSAHPVYSLGVSIQVASGAFHRTKIVTLSPRYVIVNAVGRSLEVTQATHGSSTLESSAEATRGTLELRAGANLPFHWPDGGYGRSRLLRMRLQEVGWGWSGAFQPDEVGHFSLRLRNAHTHAVYIARVEVSLRGSTIVITFRAERTSAAPYRIANDTLETLYVHQEGVREAEVVLLPYSSSAYAWDEPTEAHRLAVSMQRRGASAIPATASSAAASNNGAAKGKGKDAAVSDKGPGVEAARGANRDFVGSFGLNVIQTFPNTRGLRVSVSADGSTRTLRFKDARLPVPGSGGGATPSSSLAGTKLFSGGESAASAEDDISHAHYHAKEHALSSKTQAGSTSASGTTAADATFDNNVANISSMGRFNIVVALNGLGVSVIDQAPRPRELMYCSVRGIVLRADIDTNKERDDSMDGMQLSLSVARLELDNQLHSTPFPVMLYPTVRTAVPKKVIADVIDERGTSELFSAAGSAIVARYIPSLDLAATAPNNDHPDRGDNKETTTKASNNQFLRINIVRHFAHSFAPGIIYVQNFSFQLLPLDINIDGVLLEALINLYLKTNSLVVDDPSASLATSATAEPQGVAAAGGSPRGRRPQGGGTAAKSTARRRASTKKARSGGGGSYGQSNSGVAPTALLLFGLHAPRATISEADGGSAITVMSSSSLLLDDKQISDEGGGNAGGLLSGSRRRAADPFMAMMDKSDAGSGADEPSTFYFEELHIHPLRLQVSFTSAGWDLSQAGGGRGGVGDGDANAAGSPNPLWRMLNAMGATITHIENAPLHLNSLALDHAFATADQLTGQIAEHYKSKAKWQVLNILGSSDILGNPVGLIKNVAAGAKAFIYEPVRGIVLGSTTEFGTGIIRGTQGLIQNWTFGLVDYVGKITSTATLGLAAVDFVDQYTAPAWGERGLGALRSRLGMGDRRQDQWMVQYHRVTQRGHGTAGTLPMNLVEGLLLGLAGLLASPAMGFQCDGVVGFLRGGVFGVVGLVLKPLTGTLYHAARTAAAIASFMNPSLDEASKLCLQRVRPPRFFRTALTPLSVFSEEDNTGEELLARVDRGRYRSDGYLWHTVIAGVADDNGGGGRGAQQQSRRRLLGGGDARDMLLLLTRERAIYACLDEKVYLEVKWAVPFSDLVLYELADDRSGGDGGAISAVGGRKPAVPPPTKSQQPQRKRLWPGFRPFQRRRRTESGDSGSMVLAAGPSTLTAVKSVTLHHVTRRSSIYRDVHDVRQSRHRATAKRAAPAPSAALRFQQRRLAFIERDSANAEVLCSVLLAHCPQVPHTVPVGTVISRWREAWRSESAVNGIDLDELVSDAGSQGGRLSDRESNFEGKTDSDTTFSAEQRSTNDRSRRSRGSRGSREGDGANAATETLELPG